MTTSLHRWARVAGRGPAPAALGLGVVFLLLFGLGGCGDAEVPPPRNLVLVVIDTLRADYLALYGGHVRTPTIDALAAEGVTFRRAFSHIPSTGPSHASLFTGLLPTEHGVQANSQILAPEQTTLAEILQGAGYSTSAVVSLGVLGRKFGFHQGFESYDDQFPDQWFRNADEVLASLEGWFERDVAAPYFLWAHFSDPHEPYAPADEPQPTLRLRLDGRDVGTVAVDGRSVALELAWPPGESIVTLEAADEESVASLSSHGLKFRSLQLDEGEIPGEAGPALELLRDEELLQALKRVRRPEGAENRPAFVMGVAFRVMNPSSETAAARLSFGAELALSEEQVRDAYAREIEYVDRQLGKFVARLKARGDWHDTLFVVTSDHGEELFEHGLRGHVHQVYEPAVHVPLLMVSPRQLPPGLVDEPTGLVDVLPTILDLLGLPANGQIHGQLSSSDRPILLTTFRPFAHHEIRALRSDRYKYIRTLQTAGSPASEALYELESDPGETRNLSGERLDVRQRLSDLLDRELAGSQAGPAEEAELTDEERRQLEALGYLVD